VAAVAFCLIAARPAIGQETRGAIEGIVTDASGGVLPGVTLVAKQISTGATQTTVSDTSGVYRFPALAPGIYSVTATLSGFNPSSMEKVVVEVGKLLRVPISMTIAGVTITETVRAETPIVDVKQNAVQATITSELIDLLPKDRTWLSAIAGIAGTNYESAIDGSRATGIMIDGASQSENRFLIDGQDTTNLRTGLSGKDIAVDFVEQIQVKQSGYNAEFRATTGGVVSAITKSGTNSYRGGIAADYQGKGMNGLLGHIRPSLTLDTQSSANNPPAVYVTTPRTSEYERYTLEPVYDIGGPIIKNRAFFFVGVNNSVRRQDRTVQWSNNVVNGVEYPAVQTFTDKDTDIRYLYNVTWNLTSWLRMRATGNNQRESDGLSLPNIDANSFVVDENGETLGISNSNPATFNPRSGIHAERRNDSYSATFDWNIDTRTYANFTGGYLDARSGNTGGDYYHGVRRTFNGSNINYLDVPAELQHASGFADNLANNFTVRDNYTRFNISGDLTRFAEWRGQHAFKFGLQYERISNDVNTGQQFPNVTLFWNGTRTTLDQRSVRGTYGYYSVVQQYTVGNIHSNNVGLFMQDQWTFNQKLTLNYGVRFDNTNIPSYRPENPGITFGWGDKVAPRLGFAYDIKGDAKWKAYGSWGIFYDIEKLEMPRGAWGADHWVTYYWTLDDYNWPAINCDGTPNSGCPGTYIEQNDLRHVSNDPNNNLVDPNLKPYKTQEFVLGLDHELNRLMSVGTRYVHKWVNTAIEDIGVQVVGIGEVFYIANPGYGLGAYPLGTESPVTGLPFPRTPFPVRDYDAVELSFKRRYANNWSLDANLTISRLYGNYSGLSNSTSESNRNSPNVTRLWDGIFMSFTEKGCPTRENCNDLANYGRISTDRPLVLKLRGTYMLPWGTSFGVDFNAQSGNLQTTTISYKSTPVMVYGPGNAGRTPVYSNTNLNFSHTFRLPRQMRVTAQFNITNLFDQDFTTTYFTNRWRDSLVIPGDNCTLCGDPFFNGFDTAAVMQARNAANANTGRLDPRFGLPSGYRGARSARFYIRFQF
jgi:outer membrane receptor protein involved in Fe transport